MQNVLVRNILLHLVIILLFSCKSNREIEILDCSFSSQDTIVFKYKPKDQSQEFQTILNSKKDVFIIFEEQKTYKLSNIYSTNESAIVLIGRNSTIIPAKTESKEPIFTFINPRKIKIENLTISGNSPYNKIKNYLVKIHTPDNKTNKIVFSNVNFIDGDKGGLMIQNILPKERKRNWFGGADTVLILDCKFMNFGNNSGLQIRGSHKNVLVDNFYGSDSLSRLKTGAMIGVSAEVGIQEDNVGNVIIRNSKISKCNKGLFAQKVQSITYKNILIDSMGHKPLYYNDGRVMGVVGIKIDDLGYGNRAVLDSIFVTNTADLPYRIFLALEESQNIGHTANVEVKYFESDVGIRLGASGNHRVLGGKLTNAGIDFLSEGNSVSNVSFSNFKSAVKFLHSNNKISNSKFFDSNIVVFKNIQDVKIDNCHVLKANKIKAFIVFDLNDPNNPNEVSITNSSAPENIYGIWSGGVAKQSKNLKLQIDKKSNLLIHNYVLEKANIRN